MDENGEIGTANEAQPWASALERTLDLRSFSALIFQTVPCASVHLSGVASTF
jgi:hypothetical protein